MEIREWLVNWFSDKIDCDKAKIDPEVNFFEEQYIDSLKVFELIIEIEATFNIKFDNSDFLDDKVHTINGLALLIEEKQA
jgi:acyl carrier protein